MMFLSKTTDIEIAMASYKVTAWMSPRFSSLISPAWL